MEYYHCHKVYATKTRGVRVADIVEFYPKDLLIPKTSSTDMAIKAATELIYALQNPTPASPFRKIGDEKLRVLENIWRNILKESFNQGRQRKTKISKTATIDRSSSEDGKYNTT